MTKLSDAHHNQSVKFVALIAAIDAWEEMAMRSCNEPSLAGEVLRLRDEKIKARNAYLEAVGEYETLSNCPLEEKI